MSSKGKRKYALKKSVEQIEDLVAAHNTTADKLKKTLDLLGFPTPSIAVTKTGIVHSNFGEIALTFGCETVELLLPGGGGALPEAERRSNRGALCSRGDWRAFCGSAAQKKMKGACHQSNIFMNHP